MMRPTVSVVILNYNYQQYVGEAIASAVFQETGDYELVEVVVVDDGSTDGSAGVYSRFPDVRVVRKRHEGFAATLTRAVREAAGDWFAPLDADDAFVPCRLRRLAPHLRDPELLFVQHGELVVDADGRAFAEGAHPGGATSTLLVRAYAAQELLPVTNELFFHVLADVGRGIRLPDLLTRYRVHEASMTDRRTPGTFAGYLAGVCEEVATRLKELAAQSPAWTTRDQLIRLNRTYRARASDQRRRAARQRQAARPLDTRTETPA